MSTSERLDYDTNIRRSVQKVKLTLADGEYRAEEFQEIHTNYFGFDILSSAVDSLIDEMEQKEDNECCFTLTDGKGNTLRLDPTCDDIREWVLGVVIAAEIVSIVEDKEMTKKRKK